MDSSSIGADSNKADAPIEGKVLALHSAWDVDRHIVLHSAEKLVLVRFSSYAIPPDDIVFHELGEPPSAGTKRSRSLAGNSLVGAEHYLLTQKMDALLEMLAPKVRKFCAIYTVDTTKVTEFNALYELGHDKDPFAVMFFFRNAHIKVDVGTGNTNKINFFAFEDWQEFLPIIEAAFRAGKLGKRIATTEKSYSHVSLRR